MLIGEVSTRSGISTRMLRHYDRIGLVAPSERTPSGYRRYSDADLQRLFYVEGLRSLGLNLHEIADVLAGLSFSPSSMVEQLISRTRDRRAREDELLHRLDQVKASSPAEWSDVLRTIALVRGLDAADPSARQRLALSVAGESNRDVAALAEAALTEPDPNVAGALHWTLARIGDDAVPILAAALESPVAERRHRAVAALVKIGAVDALADALGHPDPVVRGRAAITIGVQGNIEAIPILVDSIAAGRDDVEAADVLGILASDHGHANEIADRITESLSVAAEDARRRLTAALADIPGPTADATLTRLVDDLDRSVALTAVYLLHTRQSKA